MTQATNTHTPPARPLTSGKTAVALLDTVAGLRKHAAQAQIQSRRGMLTGSAALLTGVTAMLAAPALAANPDAELISLCSQFRAYEEQHRSYFPGGANPVEDDDERAAIQEPIYERQVALVDKIVDLQATTIQGAAAVAQAALAWWIAASEELESEIGLDQRLTGFLLRSLAGVRS